MKKVKRMIAVLISMAMIFQGSAVVFAEEYVDQAEISNRFNTICEKYGVKYELLSYDKSVKYTRQEVEDTLAEYEEGLKNIGYLECENVITEDTIQPRVMEITKTYTTTAYASNGVTGGATIQLSCKGKVNLGSVSFINVSNISTKQYGSATNFVSWSQKSSSYSFINGQKQAKVQATGTLVTEANILGVRQRQTYDHVIGMTIVAQ